jgi:hypothetical protein
MFSVLDVCRIGVVLSAFHFIVIAPVSGSNTVMHSFDVAVILPLSLPDSPAVDCIEAAFPTATVRTPTRFRTPTAEFAPSGRRSRTRTAGDGDCAAGHAGRAGAPLAERAVQAAELRVATGNGRTGAGTRARRPGAVLGARTQG